MRGEFLAACVHLTSTTIYLLEFHHCHSNNAHAHRSSPYSEQYKHIGHHHTFWFRSLPLFGIHTACYIALQCRAINPVSQQATFQHSPFRPITPNKSNKTCLKRRKISVDCLLKEISFPWFFFLRFSRTHSNVWMDIVIFGNVDQFRANARVKLVKWSRSTRFLASFC